MAVPPCHPAVVRAELLLPATLGLHQRLTTILTSPGAGDMPVAMDVGTNGAGAKAKLGSNLGRTVSLQPHIVNGDLILQFHSDTPSVITAKCWGEQPCRVTLPGYFILRTLLREYR